jgi:hypothetical protein
MCVGYNHFQFAGFYHMASERQHSVGVTAADRRLEAMLAVQERTTMQIDQLGSPGRACQ